MPPFARAALVLLLSAAAARATPPARSRLLTAALHEPVAIAPLAGDPGHIAVAQREGLVRIIDTRSGDIAPAPLLDITAQVTTLGDGGLLGLAFDPAWPSQRFVYVFYNHADDNNRILARFQVPTGGLTADPASLAILWNYPRPVGHNGGWIGFSPVNNLLYLSQGDGGNTALLDSPNRAQTIVNMLMGKILRIDVRAGDDFPADTLRNYHIPASNPFVGATGDDEIWAYGLRNPWRCSFDRATGELYIADVGQAAREEIDREPAAGPGGRNYGWRCMEGTTCTGLGGCTCGDPGLTPPIYKYDQSRGDNSITGGYVYRGGAIPAYAGLYFFADFGSGRVSTFRPVPSGIADLTDRSAELGGAAAGGPVQNISAFGEDSAGELYMTDFWNGRLWAIIPFDCPADINNSGAVTVQDIFDFLALYFTADPRADFNRLGGISVQDIFDFLSAYFTGC